MSGHSKWSTIKHKKEAEDAKKGKIFSDLAKKIRIAVREGGSADPKFNANLRLILDKARAVNLPKENIKRAIDRGLGRGDNGVIEEVIYEGFGPGGVGMIVVCLTDNKQRTSSEIRNLFNKAGGSLGSPGSVMYMFRRQGEDYFPQISLNVSAEIKASNLALAENLRQNQDVEDVFLAIS